MFASQLLGRPLVGLGRPVVAITFPSTAGAVIALTIDGVLTGLLSLTLAVFLAITIIGALLHMLERRFKMGLSNDFSIAFPQVAAKFGFLSATEV
jgi:hypothetical protein